MAEESLTSLAIFCDNQGFGDTLAGHFRTSHEPESLYSTSSWDLFISKLEGNEDPLQLAVLSFEKEQADLVEKIQAIRKLRPATETCLLLKVPEVTPELQASCHAAEASFMFAATNDVDAVELAYADLLKRFRIKHSAAHAYWSGQILEAQGRFPEAVDAYSMSLDETSDPSLKVDIGRVYFFANRRKAGKRYFLEAIKESFELRGVVAKFMHEFEKGKLQIPKVAEPEPEDQMSPVWDELLKAVFQTFKDDPEGLVKLGKLFYENQLIRCARAVFHITVESQPKNLRALTFLTKCEINLNNIDDAITLGKRVAKLKPNYTEIYNLLGIAYKKKNRLEDALNQYEMGLVYDPKNAKLRHNMNIVLSLIKKID